MARRDRVLGAGLLLALLACGEGEDRYDGGLFLRDAGVPRDATPMEEIILVTDVIDGDTIVVSATATVKSPDGRAVTGQHIRLLGIDAPEIAHPPTPADCWGDEAAVYARMLLGGKKVGLRYDTVTPDNVRDRFDRLLAYVVLEDQRVANEVLLSTGNARSFRAFPHLDTQKYNSLEAAARTANLGMWSCP